MNAASFISYAVRNSHYVTRQLSDCPGISKSSYCAILRSLACRIHHFAALLCLIAASAEAIGLRERHAFTAAWL